MRARGQVVVQEGSEVIEEPGPHPPPLFLRPTRLTEASGALGDFADKFRADIRHDPKNALESLMLGVREHVDYQPGITHSATAATEAFGARAGVCQDHAHIFVACCRRLSIPARYVSGYLGTESDGRMASHAWAEAWVDGEGWRSYDIANRIRPAGRHVRVAVGLDYLDACPVRGFRRGGLGESLEVEVRVNDAQQIPSAGPAAKKEKESNGHAQQQQSGRQQQQ